MAFKIITCPWCGKEARITYEENRVYQMKCYACHNSILHEDRSFDRAVEFFEHQANLLQAEKDGRLAVLPCGTDVELIRDGYAFKADHWNHTLTAFRDEPKNKSGKQIALFSTKEAEAAMKGGDG